MSGLTGCGEASPAGLSKGKCMDPSISQPSVESKDEIGEKRNGSP